MKKEKVEEISRFITKGSFMSTVEAKAEHSLKEKIYKLNKYKNIYIICFLVKILIF